MALLLKVQLVRRGHGNARVHDVGAARGASQCCALPARSGPLLALGLAGGQLLRDGLGVRHAGADRHVHNDSASAVEIAVQASADRGLTSGSTRERTVAVESPGSGYCTWSQLQVSKQPLHGLHRCGARCRRGFVSSGLMGPTSKVPRTGLEPARPGGHEPLNPGKPLMDSNPTTSAIGGG